MYIYIANYMCIQMIPCPTNSYVTSSGITGIVGNGIAKGGPGRARAHPILSAYGTYIIN